MTAGGEYAARAEAMAVALDAAAERLGEAGVAWRTAARERREAGAAKRRGEYEAAAAHEWQATTQADYAEADAEVAGGKIAAAVASGAQEDALAAACFVLAAEARPDSLGARTPLLGTSALAYRGRAVLAEALADTLGDTAEAWRDAADGGEVIV